MTRNERFNSRRAGQEHSNHQVKVETLQGGVRNRKTNMPVATYTEGGFNLDDFEHLENLELSEILESLTENLKKYFKLYRLIN